MFSALLNAQSTVDSSNVYYQALRIHLMHEREFVNDNPINKIPEKYFVEKDDYTTGNLPNEIDGQKIQILDRAEIFNKSSKSFTLISIRPARWTNGRLEIHVIDFGITKKRKKLLYANAGGSSFEIISNEQQKVSVKLISHSAP